MEECYCVFCNAHVDSGGDPKKIAWTICSRCLIKYISVSQEDLKKLEAVFLERKERDKAKALQFFLAVDKRTKFSW